MEICDFKVVDAAQVNRGILISRTPADKKDLLESAQQLTDALITKYVQHFGKESIKRALTPSLESIVRTYHNLDGQEDIGGGHFFSMRDFFFCVKNFVCSVFEFAEFDQLGYVHDVHISEYSLVQSAIRNFGGHEKARSFVSKSMAENINTDRNTIHVTFPRDLVVLNIRDSSKKLSIHIARHLMILNRSLTGLQLLNRHVRHQLDSKMSWNVLFGSCFPGDLQVTAVTRKLRQVEQAIRKGGVLVLCHANQLFESLYMVLNQQYWAQGEVTMTQIALGPSIRAIALPDGPFRIIALQDTDVALNPELMSPAILSRFEKHELRASHLLEEVGRDWLHSIESHPIWLAIPDVLERQKLLYGYNEESFALLALDLQEKRIRMEGDEIDRCHAIWMRAVNPMAMIKLESNFIDDLELLEACQLYRQNFVFGGIDDALGKIESKRAIIMTNSLRHLEITSSTYRCFTIHLFDIQTELQFHGLLNSIQSEDLADPEFCLFVQYDAMTGPIEQYQLAKYEVGQFFEKVTKCRVVFIVHVEPRPINMHWAFSFGDGWDYVFVDEVVPGGPADRHYISLDEFVLSSGHNCLSRFINAMSIDSFKSLLLEMLGPVLQTSLDSLNFNLGQFYSGVRTALGLRENLLIELLRGKPLNF